MEPDLEGATAQVAQADTAVVSTDDGTDSADQQFDPTKVETFEDYADVAAADVLKDDPSMPTEQQKDVASSSCATYTLGTRYYGGPTYSQKVTWCWNGSRVTSSTRSARTGTTGGALFWKFTGHIDAQEAHAPDWAEYYTQGSFQWCITWACTDHQPEVNQWVDACGGHGGTAQFN